MAIATEIVHLNNSNFASSSITTIESKNDVYNEQFHLPCYTINNTNTKTDNNFKHGPPPPHHTHNITHSPSPNNKPKTNVSDETTLTDDPSINNANNINNISPKQWKFIQNKMNNIIPYINAIQNNELSRTHTHAHLVEEDDNSDHLSDDDVLNGIANMPSNPIPKPQNHQYKKSVTVTFDPKGYDGVVNALDVLQNFFNISDNKYNNNMETDESKNESNIDTNSDDDVLSPNFEQDININVVKGNNNDVSEDGSHVSNNNNNKIYVQNKYSAYDTLAFDIANSVHDIEKKENKHQRKATPIPRKNKYRIKSPIKSPKTPVNMNKKNTISLTEMLSETAARNYNITPQSQTNYLIPNQNIISPSNSIASPTEMSLVENVDQYDYKHTSDGGMKEFSQSYQIKPIVNNNNNNNNNNVDIIKEEREYDTYNYNQHMHEIGMILKQPSHSNNNNNNRPIFRYQSLNKRDDEIDNDMHINALVTIPSTTEYSPNHTNKHVSTDNSMIAHFDEQSTRTFQKDYASTVNSVNYNSPAQSKSTNTFNPKYIINRNKSLNQMDETDESISLVQTNDTNEKKNMSSPHQYAIRSNINSIEENETDSNNNTVQPQHNIAIIHKDESDNNNNCQYLSNNKIALSLCFFLGFIMGILPGIFGYPYFIFFDHE